MPTVTQLVLAGWESHPGGWAPAPVLFITTLSRVAGESWHSFQSSLDPT